MVNFTYPLLNILHLGYDREIMNLYFDVIAGSLNTVTMDYYKDENTVLSFVEFLIKNNFFTIGSLRENEFVPWNMPLNRVREKLSIFFELKMSWNNFSESVSFVITEYGIEYFKPCLDAIDTVANYFLQRLLSKKIVLLCEIFLFVKSFSDKMQNEEIAYIVEEALFRLLNSSTILKCKEQKCVNINFEPGDELILDLASRNFPRGEVEQYIIKYDDNSL